MDIILIHPNGLRAVWDQVRAGLEKMPPADWIVEDVYHAIRSGGAALYVGANEGGFAGFMVLRRLQAEFSMRPELHVWLTYNAGDADVMEAGLRVIRESAQRAGAQRITFGSPRKGWAKRYQVIESTYEIPLQEAFP